MFGCVSEAMERDGILAAIPQEFVLNTLAVQKGTVGEDFDVGKIIELAKNSGGKRLFMAINRGAVNGQLLNSVLNECVDVSAGKCDFSSGAFTDYLDYLMTLPENDEDAMYDGANHYAAGEIMFYQARIGAISDYAMTLNIFGDAGADICGYPSSDGGRADLFGGHLLLSCEKKPREGRRGGVPELSALTGLHDRRDARYAEDTVAESHHEGVGGERREDVLLLLQK